MNKTKNTNVHANARAHATKKETLGATRTTTRQQEKNGVRIHPNDRRMRASTVIQRTGMGIFHWNLE